MSRPGGACWPSPDQELLLRAALLPAPAAVRAWRAVGPRIDLATLDRASLQLLPLLGANLRRHGIDDVLIPRIEGVRRAAALHNRLLFEGGRTLVEALAQAGIPSLLLKGYALALTHYREPGLRPMRDIDVLVPTASAATAIATLRQAGWAASTPITPPVLRMQHAATLDGAGFSRCDLHWHAYWECCAADDDEALWAESVPLDLGGVVTRMLGPADQLLHVLVHGTRRTPRAVLLWIPDAMLVLRAAGIDWDRFIAQAAARRFVLRARSTLEYLRSAFGAPVPDGAVTRLRRLPVSLLERVEYAVINRPQGLLGELPSYCCNYLRIREKGRFLSPLGFSRYLQCMWQLESVPAAARGALARARTRLRGAISRPPLVDRASRRSVQSRRRS